MGALVRLLLPQFLRRYAGWLLHTASDRPSLRCCVCLRLVEDYQRWATDPVYRAARGRRKD